MTTASAESGDLSKFPADLIPGDRGQSCPVVLLKFRTTKNNPRRLRRSSKDCVVDYAGVGNLFSVIGRELNGLDFNSFRRSAETVIMGEVHGECRNAFLLREGIEGEFNFYCDMHRLEDYKTDTFVFRYRYVGIRGGKGSKYGRKHKTGN